MEDHDEDDGGPPDGFVDPTAVVGRRVAGWFVDVALVGAAGLIALVLLGDSFERPGSDVGIEVRQFGSDTAIFFRSTVAVIHTWEWVTAGVVAGVAALLLLVALPGRRGWTPGLLAAELRLVDGDGERTGIGRALIRFAGWVVDILPGVPLVGFTAMRLGRHHQRVGDRLARTYVVDAAFAGRPPTELVSDEAAHPAVLPDPSADEGTDPPGGVAHEEATVRRRRWWRGRAEPEEPGASDAGAEAPEPAVPTAAAPATAAWAPEDDDADAAPGPETAPGDPAAGDAPPTAESVSDPSAGGDGRAPDGEAPAEPPEGVVADQPLWDRRHERYVMWHGRTGRWVFYDDGEGAWKPL